jgi:thiamine-phosphate pyrophosphorylase
VKIVSFLGSFRRRGDSFSICTLTAISNKSLNWKPASISFCLFISFNGQYNHSVMERMIYRIIDANFNRAREAARVVEEYCRFAINSESLYKRAKKMRHELSSAVKKLDNDILVSCRDTIGDVGVGKAVESQLYRRELKDCFTAGCKRLTEALRVLAETIQTVNHPVAEAIENLRYDTYTLEKDIVFFSDTQERFKRIGLYVVITSTLPSEIISLTQYCSAGGADCIQLRAKDINDDELFATAVEFVHLCKDNNVVCIINDRVDVAVAAGADGVHLGQNDLPVTQARRLQMAPLIIGKSTHSIEQLEDACNELPTYVGLGPVFATSTKPSAQAVGVGYIKKAKKILDGTGIGHAAIGGINLENIDEVLNAGAECIAVCSAVTQSSNPTDVCKSLKHKIETHLITRADVR